MMTIVYWVAATWALLCSALVMLLAVAPARRARSFETHAEQAMAVARPRLRCLVCGGMEVEDYLTHSRLAHHPSRPVGVEDRADWGTR